MGAKRNAYRILMRKLEGEVSVRSAIRERNCRTEAVECYELDSCDSGKVPVASCFKYGNEHSSDIKCVNS
jgi:hypothetical protein